MQSFCPCSRTLNRSSKGLTTITCWKFHMHFAISTLEAEHINNDVYWPTGMWCCMTEKVVQMSCCYCQGTGWSTGTYCVTVRGQGYQQEHTVLLSGDKVIDRNRLCYCQGPGWSTGTYCVTVMGQGDLQEHTVLMSGDKVIYRNTLCYWTWKHQQPLAQWHGITSQKTEILKITNLNISQFALILCFSSDPPC
jgi:hypothetical protein